MRLVYGHDQQVAEWVAARIPQMESAADFGFCSAIGVVREDGTPLAGVVYSNYVPRHRSLEMSFASASPRWLTKNLIQKLMSYPFDQLNCQRVTALTPRRAASARRFLDTFGFKREGLVRRGFGDDDAVISGLLKREWLRSKWIAPLKPREGPSGEVCANTAASAGPERDSGCAVVIEHRDGAEPVSAEQRQQQRPNWVGDEHLQPLH